MARETITRDEVRELEGLAQRLFQRKCDIRLTSSLMGEVVDPTINWPGMGDKSIAETEDFIQTLRDATLWLNSLDCIGAKIIRRKH